MGRSKFPGKPSKHMNRQRVNVLPPNGESSSVDDLMTVTENKQEANINDFETFNTPQKLTRNIALRRKLSKKMQNSQTVRSNASKIKLISKLRSKNTLTKNKISVGRKCYSSLKNKNISIQRESNNLGKFILPSRSVHSSRVIKPNKRFLSMEINESVTCKQKLKATKVDKAFKSNQNDNSLTDNADKVCSSNGKVVLRQARFQVQSQTHSGSEGPFSSCQPSNNSPPGTVTCGVCGAVRFYRFVKQARKFNIYSCESCRKFISKMIKRQSCGKGSGSTLVCHKGQGMCHVPPIVRSQQWKLIRCAYRARCPACWLKMCLRSFQMPTSLKTSLSQLLPTNMKASDTLFNNSVSLLWSKNVSHEKKDIKPNDTIPNENQIKQRPTRNSKPIQTVPAPVTSDIKRQKIDLKGPRVKHVCRSASIVLGQPFAMFTDSEKKTVELKEVKEGRENTTLVTSEVSSKNETKCQSEVKDALKTDPVSVSVASESEVSETQKIKFRVLQDHAAVANVRRERQPKTTSHTFIENKWNTDKNRGNIEIQHAVSIDFWESYDPEDVSQNGFSLISSEKFPMSSICFLCGSAGREALLHCSVCCEPYHSYCLEQNPLLENNNTSQFMWLCPRCTVCSTCNQSDRTKLNCQKCYKPYHPECFNFGYSTKWSSEDCPSVCSKCLRCKSCGTENITKFVGNLPLCLTCLKLRKKGNFCPLCQKCYDDNDFCTKMMECANCNKWVHSKCEGLLEEQYQILSLLPESVEYICKLCSKTTTPYWREAVDFELKASFNNVLRLLSKNKVARNMLKWSPVSNNSATSKTITNVKKLNFSDDETHTSTNFDININNSNKTAILLDKSEPESRVLCPRTMVEIKNKLNSNDYHSVRDYNHEMEEALNYTQSDQLLKIYRSILHTVFPWYESSASGVEPVQSVHVKEESPKLVSRLGETCPSPEFEFIQNDNRICGFCKGVGDGMGDHESRLLYCGQNEWVHANCALWSSEVYEEIDGSLQNVHSALSRGRLIRCAHCKQKGASVGCCHKNCYETYHFLCAQNVKCQFLHDKTVYCACHELPKSSHIITSLHDFDIRRSVYVELDRKKGKYCEINKVNFMVGSLCVTNLGKINPSLSDGYDAIIPTGFTCSRLYWSTVEPWKLVCYNITTSSYSACINTSYADKNFTVDHSLSEINVDKKLKEINLWQKDLERKRPELIDLDYDEEPQNGADLLSPELTDAILKELPHDLLDGISVQDIIPFEDLNSMDINSESNSEPAKRSDLIDYNLSDSDKANDELKGNKSDIILQTNGKETQPRSCSLTLSCKLDRSLSPITKKRKIIPTRENNLYFQLLQVDGAFDDSSSSECGSPLGVDHSSIWDIVSEEPVTCEKCQCTYRTQASYRRHLENCDLLCTSESDSEIIQEHDGFQETTVCTNALNSVDNGILLNETNQPLVISSFESYQNEIHTSVLNTHHTFMSSKSSEVISDPELTLVDQKPVLSNLIPQCSLPVSVTPMMNQSNQTSVTQPHNQTYTLSQSVPISIGNSTYCVNPSVSLCVNQPLTLQPSTIMNNTSTPILNTTNQYPISINQMQPNNIQQPIEYQQQPITIQSVPYTNSVNHPMISVNHGKLLPNGNMVNSMMAQTISIPTNQWVKTISKPTIVSDKMKPKPRPKLISKRPQFGDGETILITPQNSSTPMIVQHLPSTSFVPYVDTSYQHPGGQNVQYIATIGPHMNQTIQTQPLVQLQSDNIISLVPGLQPTMIIQQPRVLENQLVMDSNGTISWAPQHIQSVQPVYYGFETIVQNTVMQSQQFLPTTMPGVLTANSSYSTTTQVFQTSKLEPVLDVSSNGYVLVNPGQLISSQPSIIPQYSQPVKSIANSLNNEISHPPMAPQPQVQQPLSQPQQSLTVPQPEPSLPPLAPTPHVQTHQLQLSPQKLSQPPVKYSKPAAIVPKSVTTNANSITLPTSPFVQEQRIPTNVVTPTPKPSTSIQSRPMNRVLPMKTATIKEKSQISPDIFKPIFEPKPFAKIFEKQMPLEKKISLPEIMEPITTVNQVKEIVNIKKIPELVKAADLLLKNDIINEIMKTRELPQKIPSHKENVDLLKSDAPLKMVFQKQSQDGTYKVSNNFVPKSTSVQVAPLKPIKSNCLPAPSENQKPNKAEKKEKKVHSQITETKFQQPVFVQERKISDNNPSIMYTIETQDGFRYSSTSVSELWSKVFETVQNARMAHNMPPLPVQSRNMLNSLQVLGLKNNGLKYLIEQLPGVAKCSKYKPTHYFPNLQIDIEEEYAVEHSYGAIKCAPYMKRYNPYDMFGWLSSKHRKPENSLVMDLEILPRRGSITNLPMAMRFRQLKLTSKYSVGVYRSSIHGRGLFCLRDIEAGEMVIEYAGEVIRSVLCDKREKEYNKKGIGCYMFRIDDNLVVDATMKGNAARFINHSCDPNCYSKVVEILGHKHIIIFALRRILYSEELTYDYKFPFEEDKIPCTCGTRRCRKFLN